MTSIPRSLSNSCRPASRLIHLLSSVRLFCMAAGVIGCSSLLAERNPTWNELEGEGFVILSDAKPRDVDRFALAYSAFYRAFEDLFVTESRRLSKSTLLLFASDKELHSHLAKEKSSELETLGFSIDVDGAPISVFSIEGDRERTLQTSFEAEGMWAIRRLGYFMPVWMTQGAGQVLSTVEVEKGRYVVGRDTRAFEGTLRVSGWLQWDRFFDIHTGSKEYRSTDGTNFHAQAWGLMHWILFKDDRGPQRFRQLVEQLRTKTALDAVQTVMSEKPDRFRDAIQSHLRKAARGTRVEFDEAAVRAAWKIHPASPARVAAARAEILARSGRTAEADVLLSQMRLQDPDSPWINEAYARRAKMSRDDAEAVRLYRAAIEAGSENPVAYLISAGERLNRSSAGGLDFEGQGNRLYVDEALGEIRRAVELDPGSGMGYQLLGRAFFVSPTVDPAMVDELSKGKMDAKSGAQVRFYLGLLYHRLGMDDACVNELSDLAEDEGTPKDIKAEAVKRLRSHPLVIAKIALKDLVDGGKFGEARRRLEPASSDSFKLSPSQRAGLATWLAEQEAIAELKVLYDGRQWPAFRAKAEAFITNHPQSLAAERVRSYLETVIRQFGSAAVK